MKSALHLTLKPLAAAVMLLGAGSAGALQFEFGDGIKASLDTTITYGVSVRTQDRDASLIGIANGGTSRAVNEDDGDLNFDKNKAFANLIKATSDLEVKYRNWGFFGRGTAFYDFDLHDSDKLGPTGHDRLGKNVVGLDAYVFGSFDPMGHTTRVRAGKQVISWGESTFILNGINVINPFDVSKLRVPGSELKEAFIPTTGVWASTEISKSLSVEGFVLTNFDKVRIDPRGSYFSNNDFASDDSDRVFLSFGRRHDLGSRPGAPIAAGNPVPPTLAPLFGTGGPLAAAAPAYQGFVQAFGPFDPAAAVWSPRKPDRDPSDSGQYGVALRYFAHELNNTEFGLYFMNYTSRTPLFSGIKGTPTSTLTGTPLGGVLCQAAQSNAALRALCHTGTANYFAEYPEDIKLYGVSFNTQVPAGIALQGEYSYRPNQPVQYATPELLLAALGLPNLITGFTQIPGQPTGATAAALVPDGTYLQGYKRLAMSQLQFTGTKSWPSVMSAEQLVVVGEAGMTWFHNLPSDVKFNGPAVFLPATALGAAVAGGAGGSVQPGGFLTNFSWGYRLAARLEYNNLIAGGNVSPRVAFSHDVKGISPTFNEKAKSASIGASWEYQRKYLVDVQYTSYFGGRTFCGTDSTPPTDPRQSASWCSSAYPLKDRDFYSITFSYSF